MGDPYGAIGARSGDSNMESLKDVGVRLSGVQLLSFADLSGEEFVRISWRRDAADGLQRSE
jgi:hypothetical protein